MAVVAVALVAAATACNNVDMRIGPGIQVGTGTSSGSHHNSLVGMWTRVVVLTDNHGTAHSSRTTWEFRSDGSATRTVVTQNLSSGISDVLTANASWHTEGSTLVITFRSPDAGTSRFGFAVVGSVLSLDGRDFVRVA
ncbi:MAG TPA: hypothetical protein VJ802_16840 [Gemmatimonadaceae bacterium]|nr:hypothetical protein [Gemmatimonadaceae bacterium]